jgi:phospholipase/carboxylesterase
LLHGYGANQYHLPALGPLIDPDARYLVVGARGPLDIDADGARWYDRVGDRPDPAQFHRCLGLVDDLLDDLCAERGFDRSLAVVGGFSQGAGLALALGLRSSERSRPAGLICMCGLLPDVEDLDLDLLSAPPVLAQHGVDDPIITADRVHPMLDRLRGAGVALTSRTYPMGHAVTLESLADARSWLTALTGGERPGD